jgi:enoyl-CoA hydratase/carnithine racemase
VTTPIRIDDRGRIRTLTIDRPERKNALNRAMYQMLADALRSAALHGDSFANDR